MKDTFNTVLLNLMDVTGENGALWKLVDAFCYFMALLFMFLSFLQAKDAAEGANRATYKAAMMTFFAAALFAAMPTSVKSVAVSFYGPGIGSPLTNLRSEDTQEMRSFRALMQFVSWFGYTFFVRGLFVLKQSGQPDRHPQSTGFRAAVILVSAMLAIYIDYTLKFVSGLTGWDVSRYLN